MDLRAQFARDPLGTILSLHREFGDFVRLKLGPFDWYSLNHPDLVKEVLVTRSKQFAKTDMFKRIFSSVDGQGLVLSEGDFWLRQRRITQPAFHHNMLVQYGQTIVAETQRAMTSWSEGQQIDLAQAMTDITPTIASKLFFGIDARNEARELADAVSMLSIEMYHEFTEIVPLPDWLPIPSKNQKREALATLDRFILGTISDRRRSNEHKNSFAFFPFGAGPRACICRDFALMEMQLVVATISQHFTFQFPVGQGEIAAEPLISLRPKGGVPAVLKARKN